MPIHDWKRVNAGIFHAFHHGWIEENARALNRGVLPKGYYALPEQIAGEKGPDVLTLQFPAGERTKTDDDVDGGIATAIAPPKVSYHTKTEVDAYAARAKALVIRHISNHEVIAMIEIVSPGNKNSAREFRNFIEKAVELIQAGIHLLIVDLLPPTRRDPQGIHKAIWDEFVEEDYRLPTDRPLTLASYVGGPSKEAFVEAVSVNAMLPEMPLFLKPNYHVMVPLEATYQSAWRELPEYWRDVLQSGPPHE